MSSDQTNPYEAPKTIEGPWVDPDQFFDGRLRTAGLGLKIIYVGILLSLVAWIGTVLASIFGLGLFFVGSLFGIVGLVGMLLINIGPFLCLTVPPASRLRLFAALTILAQVFTFISLGISMISVRPTAVWALITSIGAMLAAALFLLFLNRLAAAIERDDLVKRARNVLIFGSVIVFVLAPVAFLIDFDRSTNIAITYTVTVALALLLFLVAYANLVNALSDAIRRPGVRKTPVGIA